MRSLVLIFLMLGALGVWLGALAHTLWAEGTVSKEPRAGSVQVPAVAGRTAQETQSSLERAGLVLGKVYEMDWRRVERTWGMRVAVGQVFSQRPQPGLYYDRGGAVDVMVAAERDGLLPAALPPEASAPPASAPATSGPASSGGATSGSAGVPPPPPPPPPPGSAGTTPAVRSPALAVPSASPEPAGVGTAPPPAQDMNRPAQGSPDAPVISEVLDTTCVPDLLGLTLNDAEQWTRDMRLSLYVERVGGHPIGRVLTQLPASGAARPEGGVIKVRVTAGGDYEDHQPGAPAAQLDYAQVPELLDRTSAQAHRILTDLGLRVLERVATRGLPGRVVDQLPSLGDHLIKGETVLIWIGPPEPPSPDTPTQAPPSVAATGPLSPGEAARVPAPIAPAEGTVIPREASLALGFSWRAAVGADAYLLEIEEETAEGKWLGILRKPVRHTATVAEVERLSTQPYQRLRWRVKAVSQGREGPASAWLVMR